MKFTVQESESSCDIEGHPAAGGPVNRVDRQVARQAALRYTDKGKCFEQAAFF